VRYEGVFERHGYRAPSPASSAQSLRMVCTVCGLQIERIILNIGAQELVRGSVQYRGLRVAHRVA